MSERPTTAAKPPVRVRHPIGKGASPYEDQLTESNREALSQCLHSYFHGTLDPREIAKYEVTTGRSSQHSATGLELGARLTSRFEVGFALRRLELERRDLYQVVTRYYDQDEPKRDIERDLHLRNGEAAKRIERALNWMIPLVFFDEEVPPPARPRR